MNVVLIRFKNGQRREIPLPAPTTVIGRRPDCNLQIPAKDVSRLHCQIAIEGSAVTLKDLGSTNGTYVNGERVEEAVLRPGDKVRVGPVVFTVQIDGQPAVIEPEPAAAAPAVPLEPVGATAPAGPPPLDEEEEPDEDQVFELTAADFDLEDAISSLEELDEDKDLP
jgi:predicted component of type VI protein secretion system